MGDNDVDIHFMILFDVESFLHTVNKYNTIIAICELINTYTRSTTCRLTDNTIGFILLHVTRKICHVNFETLCIFIRI